MIMLNDKLGGSQRFCIMAVGLVLSADGPDPSVKVSQEEEDTLLTSAQGRSISEKGSVEVKADSCEDNGKQGSQTDRQKELERREFHSQPPNE